MVRAAALGLLLLASTTSAQEGPWDRYRGVEGETSWQGHRILWQSRNTTGTQFIVYDDEFEYRGTGAVAWVHGHHQNDSTVAYRRSLFRIHFNCQGESGISAFTAYDADGRTAHSWDQWPRYTALRPGSVYKNLSDLLCVVETRGE